MFWVAGLFLGAGGDAQTGLGEADYNESGARQARRRTAGWAAQKSTIFSQNESECVLDKQVKDNYRQRFSIFNTAADFNYIKS